VQKGTSVSAAALIRRAWLRTSWAEFERNQNSVCTDLHRFGPEEAHRSEAGAIHASPGSARSHDGFSWEDRLSGHTFMGV